MKLPIVEIEEEILQSFRENPRLILQAPTGSGKSTQVPQFLLDGGLLGDGEVVVLQPRRLPARMLAKRVAEERGIPLGDEVGYQIRFERVCSSKTRIRFVTEGVVLRQMIDNPGLDGVSAILFDEFHERHLFGDITLARALQIQKRNRPDLKIGVMSATLDVAILDEHLHPSRTLTSVGRTYPVDVEYLRSSPLTGKTPISEVAARELDRLVREGYPGDALVIMPGAYEIQRTIEAIGRSPSIKNFAVFPLHGELPAAVQDKALDACDTRKIVVATNVVETSLTIEGIRIVVDSGLAKIPRFDPVRGINTLFVEKISRASADQRTGRAGRTAPGHCLRLWTEKEHEYRLPAELPEVKRLELSEILLTLKGSGISHSEAFPWLEPPEPNALERAETLLSDLGASDPRDRRITDLGKRMLAFPLHPRYSRMLLAAEKYGCVPTVALIAAMTQTRDFWLGKAGSHVERKRDERLGEQTQSDFFARIQAWNYAAKNKFSLRECQEVGIHAGNARQAGRLVSRFLDIARRENLDVSEDATPASDGNKPVGPEEAIRRCILLGFSDQVAIRSARGSQRFHLVHGRAGTLGRESVVRDSPLLVASEVKEIKGKGGEVTVFLDLATAIEETWLEEFFPDDFSRNSDLIYDSSSRRVVVQEKRLFRDLVLETGRREDPPLDQAASILAAEVVAGRCPLKNWTHAVDQWIARVNAVAEWMPELEIPPIEAIDRAWLIEQVCYGAVSYKEIKDRPVLSTVQEWLSPEQQACIDIYAPAQVTLPSGRKAKVVYSDDAPPSLSARIQDLYDVEENLFVADGRVAVRIHLLAPNQRPIQITQNLADFWQNSYPEIKKQLQGRYPKHEWR